MNLLKLKIINQDKFQVPIKNIVVKKSRFNSKNHITDKYQFSIKQSKYKIKKCNN